MDEPEAALSFVRQLALMRRMQEVAEGGGQFVVATHSPILLAFPDARIYECSEHGIDQVAYEDTPAFYLTKSFLEDPKPFLRALFDDDGPD